MRWNRALRGRGGSGDVQSRLIWDSANDYCVGTNKIEYIIADRTQFRSLGRENKTCPQDSKQKRFLESSVGLIRQVRNFNAGPFESNWI